ncbi:hypothetical protein EJ06DRAFT_481729 [Trichodelitschia bisporula]|uniref:Zn(2)-C6 fungal-type domain-containing protein n=1 Tax=Trichodelitschia bisporula TaxID=703511 RepID=A0A6G1HN54_9PEZI|nr:hypothetical protein EJ06DRAFT_481729 [Trichodelitschia bisporula]
MSSSAAIQKRARQQLSCTFCRAGKLRCDRKLPCDQCTKRARSGACAYLAPPPKKKQSRNTKDRIAHLEGLVVQLMSQGGGPTPETTPPSQSQGSSESEMEERKEAVRTEPDANGFGQMKISNGETCYVGSAHWEAILESIAEVKEALQDDDDEHEPDPEAETPDTLQLLMLGVPASVTRADLLREIPAKSVCDTLLWHWFNSNDPAMPAIHRPTFLSEYEQLWKEPKRLPTMWLALFFNILTLGCRIVQHINLGQHSAEAEFGSADRYQNLAAAALALGDYMRLRKYTVEALLTHASCEYMKQPELPTRIWMLTALLIRVALRMGYHRDPSHYPNITPFEGEMRRRCWVIIYTYDVLGSFQLALPGMARHIQADIGPPSNLLDTDFGPETKELPPSRPFNELSAVSYCLTKCHYTRIFADASEISHAVNLPDYDEVERLDAALQKIYDDTPPILKFRPLDQSILDPPALIFNRFKLELLSHKTRCILHRRYLIDDLPDPRMRASRRICVESAMKLLDHLITTYDAAREGGQLSIVRSFMASLSSHDFLLAAMVLCLELNAVSKPSFAAIRDDWADVGEMKRLLHTAYSVYKHPFGSEAEAEKARRAMAVMLRRLDGESSVRAVGSANELDVPESPEPPSVPQTQMQAPTSQPGPDLLLMQPQQPQPTEFYLLGPEPEYYEPIGGMISPSQVPDWVCF